MSDLPVIFSAISSLKTAIDIAKILRSTDGTLERAELKLKLADLTEALADAKLGLASVKDELEEKDREIERLDKLLSRNVKPVRSGDAYYLASATGKPVGEPMCFRCWEIEHRQFELYTLHNNYRVRVCPACQSHYDGDMAQSFPAAAENAA